MTASRSTFRKKCRDLCYQKELRDRYLAEGAPAGVDLALARAVVRPVSKATAEQIILKYEWLGTMAKTGHHFGIFFGPFCAGVTCVAVGGGAIAGAFTHQQFGIELSELAILARGACVHWAPPGTNSKLVSWTSRLFPRSYPAKILMAFADTDAGEVGTIYQACNWTYIGRSKPSTELVSPTGRVYNRKLYGDVAKKNGIDCGDSRTALLKMGWREQPTNPKHRYVQILAKADRALVDRVLAMALPYPKRSGGSIDADAPGDQPGEGGSIPTPPLQSQTEGGT